MFDYAQEAHVVSKTYMIHSRRWLFYDARTMSANHLLTVVLLEIQDEDNKNFNNCFAILLIDKRF